MSPYDLPKMTVAIRDTNQRPNTDRLHPHRYALAALPGLCAWAADRLASESISLKTKFGEGKSSDRTHTHTHTHNARTHSLTHPHSRSHTPVAYEAGEAIALGRPRAGHSVLGQGTFRDAQKIWEHLALDFAQTAQAKEVAPSV